MDTLTILDKPLPEKFFWLAPFVNKPFSFAADRSEFTYFTDWTFGIELFLLLLALSLLNIRSEVPEGNERKIPITVYFNFIYASEPVFSL